MFWLHNGWRYSNISISPYDQQERETPPPVYLGMKLQNAGGVKEVIKSFAPIGLWVSNERLYADHHKSSNVGFWTVCPWWRCSSI